MVKTIKSAKNQNISEIVKRLKKAFPTYFHIPLYTLRTTDNSLIYREYKSLVRQALSSVKSAWVLIAYRDIGIYKNKYFSSRLKQLLEDITWINEYYYVLKSHNVLLAQTFLSGDLFNNELKELLEFEKVLADYLENGISYDKCCNKKVMDSVSYFLTDLSIKSAKDLIETTRTHAPITIKTVSNWYLSNVPIVDEVARRLRTVITRADNRIFKL